ncbi:MAG: response regulator [Promethearchaeota archaeon]
MFIVEDDLNIIKLYKNALEMFGHTVIDCAFNGNDAILKFKNFNIKPDIIIMDHRMPFKNGIETMKEILEIDPNIKIIFASADNQIKNLALESGALIFQEKPFSIIKLRDNITNALNSKSNT